MYCKCSVDVLWVFGEASFISKATVGCEHPPSHQHCGVLCQLPKNWCLHGFITFIKWLLDRAWVFCGHFESAATGGCSTPWPSPDHSRLTLGQKNVGQSGFGSNSALDPIFCFRPPCLLCYLKLVPAKLLAQPWGDPSFSSSRTGFWHGYTRGMCSSLGSLGNFWENLEWIWNEVNFSHGI